MIKLILADMDGTLLPFGSRVVSERTHSAILSALDADAGTSLWLVADVDETGKRCEQFLCAVEPGDEFALEIVKDSGRDMALGDVPTNRDVITAGIFVNVSSAPTEVVRSR